MQFTSEMADVQSATQPTFVKGRPMEYPMGSPMDLAEDKREAKKGRKMKGASMKGGKGMSKKMPFGKKPTSGTRKAGSMD